MPPKEPKGPKPRAATVEVRNCLNCGRGFRGVEVWCSVCRSQFAAAYDSIVNPVELPPNSPTKQRAIDIVLAQAFADPWASGGGLR